MSPPYQTKAPFVAANPSYDQARESLVNADYLLTRTFVSDDPTYAPECRFEVWHNHDSNKTILLQVWRHIEGEDDAKGFTAYVDWPIGSSIEALKQAIS